MSEGRRNRTASPGETGLVPGRESHLAGTARAHPCAPPPGVVEAAASGSAAPCAMAGSGLPRPVARAGRAPRPFHVAATRRSGRWHGGGDDHEAEHPHEGLGGVGRRPSAVVLPAVLVHRLSRAAPCHDPPIKDHAPAARGFLAALKELAEIGQGTADDHEVAGRGTEPRRAP